MVPGDPGVTLTVFRSFEVCWRDHVVGTRIQTQVQPLQARRLTPASLSCPTVLVFCSFGCFGATTDRAWGLFRAMPSGITPDGVWEPDEARNLPVLATCSALVLPAVPSSLTPLQSGLVTFFLFSSSLCPTQQSSVVWFILSLW